MGPPPIPTEFRVMTSLKLLGAALVAALCVGSVAADDPPKVKTARVYLAELEIKDKTVQSIDVVQVIDAKKGKSDAHHFEVTDKTKFIMAIGPKETEFDRKTVLSDKMAPNYFKKDVWVTVTVEDKKLTSVKFTNKKADMGPGPGTPPKP